MIDQFDLEEEEERKPSGPPAWVVTFGDMMALLLVFFVLLFSFSEVDAIRFAKLMGALKNAFGVQPVQMLSHQEREEDLTAGDMGGAGISVLDELNAILPQAVAGGQVVGQARQGTLLVIPGRLLFELGEATLKSEMHPRLREVADLLHRRPNILLQVEGHTDDLPINTPQFRSNWELSAARAIAVIRFLLDQCDVPPDRVAAAGYADSRPMVPNDGEESREKNRRVEFLFVERDPQ